MTAFSFFFFGFSLTLDTHSTECYSVFCVYSRSIFVSTQPIFIQFNHRRWTIFKWTNLLNSKCIYILYFQWNRRKTLYDNRCSISSVQKPKHQWKVSVAVYKTNGNESDEQFYSFSMCKNSSANVNVFLVNYLFQNIGW